MKFSFYRHTLIFLAFGINHGVFFGSRFANIPLKYTNLKVLPSAFNGSARDFVKASAAASVYPISIFLQSSRFGFLWAGEPRALSESASVGRTAGLKLLKRVIALYNIPNTSFRAF
jgi:hypothetical protein